MDSRGVNDTLSKIFSYISSEMLFFPPNCSHTRYVSVVEWALSTKEQFLFHSITVALR